MDPPCPRTDLARPQDKVHRHSDPVKAPAYDPFSSFIRGDVCRSQECDVEHHGSEFRARNNLVMHDAKIRCYGTNTGASCAVFSKSSDTFRVGSRSLSGSPPSTGGERFAAMHLEQMYWFSQQPWTFDTWPVLANAAASYLVPPTHFLFVTHLLRFESSYSR